MNHPNRSKRIDAPGRNPKAEEIRAAREAAGLSEVQAARLIYGTITAWQRWETGERAMHPAIWELFRIKTGQIETP